MPEMNNNNDGKPVSWWQALWRRPRAWWLFGIPIGAFLAFVLGIIFWGGFNTAMELSNKEAFCISCHEMRDNVYQEYKTTIHYSNRTGVRAICSDCHVPKEWIYKFIRKIKATNELFHHFAGTVSTREKFEAHRLKLAQNVWRTMKATNSRECRNCHAIKFMDLEKQSKSARKKHTLKREQEGETCIECHKGIAHHLPKEVGG
jgi:cytochrome c-type protein NapC